MATLNVELTRPWLSHLCRLLIDQTQSPHFRGYSTFKTETTFGKSDLRDQVSQTSWRRDASK